MSRAKVGLVIGLVVLVSAAIADYIGAVALPASSGCPHSPPPSWLNAWAFGAPAAFVLGGITCLVLSRSRATDPSDRKLVIAARVSGIVDIVLGVASFGFNAFVVSTGPLACGG